MTDRFNSYQALGTYAPEYTDNPPESTDSKKVGIAIELNDWLAEYPDNIESAFCACFVEEFDDDTYKAEVLAVYALTPWGGMSINHGDFDLIKEVLNTELSKGGKLAKHIWDNGIKHA